MLHDAKTSHFDVIVVDEAAQIKECESLIPLMLKQVKHALLVGDEFQLPALVQSLVSSSILFFWWLYRNNFVKIAIIMPVLIIDTYTKDYAIWVLNSDINSYVIQEGFVSSVGSLINKYFVD